MKTASSSEVSHIEQSARQENVRNRGDATRAILPSPAGGYTAFGQATGEIRMRKLRLVFLALPAAAALAFAQGGMVQFLPNDIKWASAPPGVTKDAQAAVLAGPLDKPNPYTQRVRLAA